MLAGVDGAEWATAAASLQVPVYADRFGVDLPRRRGDGARHRPQGALLVRPDGVVAWRRVGPASDPTSQLRGVLRAVLGVPA